MHAAIEYERKKKKKNNNILCNKKKTTKKNKKNSDKRFREKMKTIEKKMNESKSKPRE